MQKLLLVAPTCDGQDVGEAWVGFRWAEELSERFDLTLLTYHKRGRPTAGEQLPGVRVVEWTEPAVLGRAERLNSLLKPAYVPFYLRARRWIRRARDRGEVFDLAFQPLPVAMRYPSPLAGLGIPYVVGPVGGSLTTPAAFSGSSSDPWYMNLRRIDHFRLRHDRLLRASFEKASCVLGIAPYAIEALDDLSLRRTETVSETAIEALPAVVNRPTTRTGPLRLLFVGRLIRTKGARDAIAAMRHLPVGLAELHIVGSGFDLDACRSLAAELDLSDRVVFHGQLPRADVDRHYRSADVFLFPSFREPGGNVTFEAMSWGLPLIVADRGGPANVVDDTCGIKVPVTTPEAFARSIAAAITRLSDDSLRGELGRGARKRVQEIGLWSAKADWFAGLAAELAPT